VALEVPITTFFELEAPKKNIAHVKLGGRVADHVDGHTYPRGWM
jgi:hypothetical protein